MKKIPLTQGKFATIDAEDFERISQHKWYFNNGRAKRGAKVRILMHREIMNAPKEFVVDHINRDPLDNRKENLRLCSPSENNFNRGVYKETKNKYRGVTGVRGCKNKWQARMQVDRKNLYLGVFNSEIEAAKAYNAAAIKHHGEYACLNKI